MIKKSTFHNSLTIICYLLLASTFYNCEVQKEEKKEEHTISPEIKYVQEDAFQQILDTALVEGTILIFDAQKKTYYSNDFEAAKVAKLPASTFKIPNSIIALETGVVEDDSTLFEWDGTDRAMDIWERDLVFRDAFHFSCVPCYQEIARAVGVERMNEYLSKLEYGNRKIEAEEIDSFWLVGNFEISPFQQIEFLSRFYEQQLAISERTHTIMKKMMLRKETATYQISGKTGWAVQENKDNGWFVGYLEKDASIYYFVSNINPTAAFDMDLFAKTRVDIVYKALANMDVL